MDVEEIHFHPKLSFFLLILVLDVFSTSTSDDEGRWSDQAAPGLDQDAKWSREEATTYDSGNCTCTVSNSHGSVSFTFEVLIQGIASIKTRFSFIALYTQR